MTKTILIDASKENETRLAVRDNGHLVDYYQETETSKGIKNNIYLVKVIRIEPALQAAFVDFGGEKNGFLSISEIHPDYYNIPQSEKDILLEAMYGKDYNSLDSKSSETSENNQNESQNIKEDQNSNDTDLPIDNKHDKTIIEECIEDNEVRQKPKTFRQLAKNYLIQDVIKKGQIILAQVIKDERGNKGASFTTYISLLGRYCIFMPNRSNSGISLKINSSNERARFKALLTDLNLRPTQGIIIRTAGINKSTSDIQADYDNLLKTWNEIRHNTVSSCAPKRIYEEDNLIIRTIREYSDHEVNEIVISGGDHYKKLKEFITITAPALLKKIKIYKGYVPIFVKYSVELDIVSIYKTEIPLKSGGAIVINPTEALVAIDVNSGKSTNDKNVEETAFRTNIDAAYEIAKQLKMRDLAGLIVIDLIDMVNVQNRITVENAFRDAFHTDKAKIHVGKISIFGLLEISRQRLNSNLLEGNVITCLHCSGTGVSLAPAVIARMIVQSLYANIAKNKQEDDFMMIEIKLHGKVCCDVLNNHTKELYEAESEHNAYVKFITYDNINIEKFDIKIVNQNKKIQVGKSNKSEYEIQDDDIVVDDKTKISHHSKSKTHQNKNEEQNVKNEEQNVKHKQTSRSQNNNKKESSGVVKFVKNLFFNTDTEDNKGKIHTRQRQQNRNKSDKPNTYAKKRNNPNKRHPQQRYKK